MQTQLNQHSVKCPLPISKHIFLGGNFHASYLDSRHCISLSLSPCLFFSLEPGSYSSKGIDPYIVFVDSSVIRGRNGTWYAGLRQLDPSEYDKYNETITPAPPARLTGRFKCNFTLLIYTSGCFYCHNGDKGWSSGGCKVKMLRFNLSSSISSIFLNKWSKTLFSVSNMELKDRLRRVRDNK